MDEFEWKEKQQFNAQISVPDIHSKIYSDWPRLDSLQQRDILTYVIKVDEAFTNLLLLAPYLDPPPVLTLLTQDVKAEIATLFGKEMYAISAFDVEIIIRETLMFPELEMRNFAKTIRSIRIPDGIPIANAANIIVGQARKMINLFPTMETKLNGDKFHSEGFVKAILENFPKYIKTQELKFYRDRIKRKRNIRKYLEVQQERFRSLYKGLTFSSTYSKHRDSNYRPILLNFVGLGDSGWC